MTTPNEPATCSVMIAMSGGVDSSVAAYLMKESGYDCAGVTMKLFGDDVADCGDESSCDADGAGGKTCCSLADVNDARKVAYALDIPFYVYNFTLDFKARVIDRFVEVYRRGATPNPCIDCNRFMKFDKLLRRAESLGKSRVVTGHYAQIVYDETIGRYLLKKAVDETKDQSYVLYSLTQEQLAHTLFPLGGMRKSEVRDIANKAGFVNANKRESQDICFVRDGDYAGFIERYTGEVFEPGDFVDVNGKVLGKHKGIIRYTIGQRKGLGLALPRPVYVRSINVADNTVTLCEDDGLFVRSLLADDFNWIAYDGASIIGKPLKCMAKVRYNQAAQPATAKLLEDGVTVSVEFDEPQRAIAKGQAVVLYDGDIVIGGGTICRA